MENDGSLDITVAGSRILVTLNTDAANGGVAATTAQQLIQALNTQATGLVAASLLLGDPDTALIDNLPVSGTILMLPDVRDAFLQREAADQFGNITLTDANRALVMSNFGAAHPLQIRLVAVEAGPARDRIELQVAGRDLGSQGVPEITVSGKTVFVTLDTDAAGGGADATTARQLIDALRTEAGSLIELSLLWGDADDLLGRDPESFPYLYSPLILRGGDDVVVTPGYVGLPNDDPGVPNTNPAEDARINRNQIIVRFAETLPDDLYRIELFAQANPFLGTEPLENRSRAPLVPSNPQANREVIEFNLELGAQVIAVIPQPVTRNVQQIEASAGTYDFMLRFQNHTTEPIASDTSVADVHAALDNLTPYRPRIHGFTVCSTPITR